MARRRRTSRIPLVVLALLALVWLWAEWSTRGGEPRTGTSVAGPVTLPSDEPPPTPAGVADQLRFVTWNVANMGRSKSDAEIELIADVLAGSADLVAIQEVSTGPPGAQAIGRLGEALARRGVPWEYRISDPTTGRGTERYAFLWRSDRVSLVGRPWLESSLADVLDREPFLARFAVRGAARTEPVLVAQMHTVPTSRDPAVENERLGTLHDLYPADDLVLAGDFNLPHGRSAFDGLRQRGFAAALGDQLTTYKAVASPSGERLASAYDNVFFEPAELAVAEAGVVDFAARYADRLPTLRDARNVSDHLPVAVAFAWR